VNDAVRRALNGAKEATDAYAVTFVPHDFGRGPLATIRLSVTALNTVLDNLHLQEAAGSSAIADLALDGACRIRDINPSREYLRSLKLID
jgi:hypothetical protein